MTKFLLCLSLIYPTFLFAVALDLDKDHEVKAIITADGGVLKTVNSRGEDITFTIPKDAISYQTEITMTPVRNISGVSLTSGLLVGVHFEPEGLDLLKTAKLTIALKSPMPTPSEIPFTYRLDTNEFYAEPFFYKDNLLSFNVTHFSGYSIGIGTDSDWQAITANEPSKVGALFSRDYAKLQKMKFDGKMTEEEFANKLDQLVNSVKNGIYSELMSKLGTSTCSVELQRLDNIRSISRNVQMGTEIQFENPDPAKVSQIYGRCSHELEKMCTDKRDVRYSMNLFLLSKNAMVAGYPDLGFEIIDAAKRCGTFQFQFESKITQKSKSFPFWANTKASLFVDWVSAELNYDDNEGTFAESELTATDSFIPSPGCISNVTTKEILEKLLFKKLKVTWKLAPRNIMSDIYTPIGEMSGVYTLFIPPKDIETMVMSCPSLPPQTASINFNYGLWGTHHYDLGEVEVNYYRINNFIINSGGAGAPAAIKSYHIEDKRKNIEDSTIQLIHMPGA